MDPEGSISAKYAVRPVGSTMLLDQRIRCSPAGDPEQPRLSSWAEHGMCPSLAGAQSSNEHSTEIIGGGAPKSPMMIMIMMRCTRNDVDATPILVASRSHGTVNGCLGQRATVCSEKPESYRILLVIVDYHMPRCFIRPPLQPEHIRPKFPIHGNTIHINPYGYFGTFNIWATCVFG